MMTLTIKKYKILIKRKKKKYVHYFKLEVLNNDIGVIVSTGKVLKNLRVSFLFCHCYKFLLTPSLLKEEKSYLDEKHHFVECQHMSNKG